MTPVVWVRGDQGFGLGHVGALSSGEDDDAARTDGDELGSAVEPEYIADVCAQICHGEHLRAKRATVVFIDGAEPRRFRTDGDLDGGTRWDSALGVHWQGPADTVNRCAVFG